jgi:hypothetical protein
MEGERAGPLVPWQSGDGDGEANRRRHYRRWSVQVRATLRIGRRRRTCIANDLSPGGASLNLFRSIDAEVGAPASLFLPGYGAVPAEVRHVDGRHVGVMFTHDGEHALRLARHLVAQRPPRSDPRIEVGVPAQLVVRGATRACRLANISRFGAGIACEDAHSLGLEEEVLLRVPGVGSLGAIVVRIGAGELGLVLVDEYLGGVIGPGESAA